EALPASGTDWRWSTLIANVIGAAALGVILVRLPNQASKPNRLRAFLATGVCGGLTTFSTMQRELLAMVDGGRGALALSYAAVSIIAGLLAVLITVRISQRGRSGR
ncbi:MAG: CrcB family protein, partial [Solirubrobacteraceae bacterium]|nr:CrcB family protein [Solirubrobacteraceae bacterium]